MHGSRKVLFALRWRLRPACRLLACPPACPPGWVSGQVTSIAGWLWWQVAARWNAQTTRRVFFRWWVLDTNEAFDSVAPWKENYFSLRSLRTCQPAAANIVRLPLCNSWPCVSRERGGLKVRVQEEIAETWRACWTSQPLAFLLEDATLHPAFMDAEGKQSRFKLESQSVSQSSQRVHRSLPLSLSLSISELLYRCPLSLVRDRPAAYDIISPKVFAM